MCATTFLERVVNSSLEVATSFLSHVQWWAWVVIADEIVDHGDLEELQLDEVTFIALTKHHADTSGDVSTT